MDLSKQQVLDVNLKVLQQINFTVNLDQDGDGDTVLYLGYGMCYWLPAL